MDDNAPTRDNRRWIELIASVVLGLSLTGYFIGIREVRSPVPTLDPGLRTSTSLASQRPNDHWINHLDNLVDLGSNPTVSKETALRRRASRRAYAGAPPVVPHPIDQMTTDSCVACHASGFRTSEISAPPMSHPILTNCTQCHVESHNKNLDSDTSTPANSFQGHPEPLAGRRASPIAPPTIPHSTWMRQNCTSCHGETGSSRIETRHPWRTNCTQCHAPSAQRDQRHFRLSDDD